MPVISKAQNAAQGKSTLGISKSVGQDFVSASKGMKVGKLPQRVNQTKSKKSNPRLQKVFARGLITQGQMSSFEGKGYRPTDEGGDG